VAGWARPGRLAAFLEGGYDLDAVSASVAAGIPELLGDRGPVAAEERATADGPGLQAVEAAAAVWR
jgi:hypothetical protein